jgi:hypothetical protein
MNKASSRRRVLRALAAGPISVLLPLPQLKASEYPSPADVFNTIDRLEADVASRLDAIVQERRTARPFVASVAADRARHRAVRASWRERLQLPRASESQAQPDAPDSLKGLRGAQKALVYAYVDGLPSFLAHPRAVHALGKNMADLARQLTVIDLWIEGQDSNGRS